MIRNKYKIINQVKSIILKYANPERIYFYGSQENGEAKKDSDIDIAYDDLECNNHSFILDEINKIETLSKIDIKNIAKSNERFKTRVKSTGRVIFSATKKLRAEDSLINFNKAFNKFAEIVKRRDEFINDGLEDIYLDIIVKRFEFTYEMSWKSLKRYLEYLGFSPKSPRESFKEGFAQGLIVDEVVWLNMIEQRNLSAHIYDVSEILGILEQLTDFRIAFESLTEEIKKGLYENR